MDPPVYNTDCNPQVHFLRVLQPLARHRLDLVPRRQGRGHVQGSGAGGGEVHGVHEVELAAGTAGED